MPRGILDLLHPEKCARMPGNMHTFPGGKGENRRNKGESVHGRRETCTLSREGRERTGGTRGKVCTNAEKHAHFPGAREGAGRKREWRMKNREWRKKEGKSEKISKKLGVPPFIQRKSIPL